MTMYYITEFCRICMQYDKNLIDIVKIEKEPAETLLSKLKLCVSEVDWNLNSILLCQPCIRRLNASYDFKKQCIVSAQTWKAYLDLLSESQKKVESQASGNVIKPDAASETAKDTDKNTQNAFIRVIPNPKLFKLYVGPQAGQNQNQTFQNVFLNIIPTNTIKTQQEGVISPLILPTGKDNSVFVNINNFQQFIPVTAEKDSTKVVKSDDINVSQILTEAKTEELSVEIDPTDFGCMSEDSPVQQPSNDSNDKDWEEVISGTKIQTSIDTVPSLVPISSSTENNFNKPPYVPIVPKPDNFNSTNDEEKFDFFNGGHFLTPKEPISKVTELNFTCDLCDRMFDTMKNLRFHVKQLHLGKFPYKCDFCYKEFPNRGAYNLHLEKHNNCSSEDFLSKETLTLKDFPLGDASPPPSLLTTAQLSNIEMQNYCNKLDNEEPEIHNCDVCGMSFQSGNGLIRHKVRKHNQKTKKKYFIKGMKNARCDICNRDFSTQSYLQIHLKLHEKKGPNYRGKIFRNKYIHREPVQNGNNVKESQVEDVIDITKDEHENGDLTETRDTLVLDEEEVEIEDDIPNALRLKMNDSRNAERRDSNADVEMEVDEADYDNISKATFTDLSLECEQYLLEQQNETNSSSDCDICKSDLSKFLSSLHSKSLQYKCHLCDSSFCEVSHLTKHLQIHFVSASCSICQKMFDDEDEMQKHSEELHENQANWQCGVCCLINNEINTLKAHIREHENQIAYRCQFCDEEFLESNVFSDHIEKHEGSYSCTECEQNFSYQHEKNIHDHSMHDKERYFCELCSKTYKTVQDIVRHQNLHQFHPYLLHTEQQE